jgi:uncharacterized membrane protein
VGLAAWIACAAPPTMAAAPGDPEPGSTASVKTNIPVRAFGTTVDFLIAYLVTGAPGISTGIALTINATDSLWFVLNDRSWTDYYGKLNAGAGSQQPLTSGATVGRALDLGGKQLPLPAGNWLVLADRASDHKNQHFGSFGYIRSLLLGRVADGRVDALLEIHTNTQPAANGWGLAFDCARSDLPRAVIRLSDGWDGSCYFIGHTLIAGASTPVWRDAAEFVAHKGWALSRVWLTAGFRATNRTDVLDVRFHFAPEARGMATETVDRWEDSAWMPARLQTDEKRAGWERAVDDWAVEYSALLDSGLKNQLPNEVSLGMPRPLDPTQDAARRVALLRLLRHATAAIPDEAAKAVQEATEGEPETPKLAPSIAEIAAIKAFSYRSIASISNLFVNYAWTGSYIMTAELEALQIMVNNPQFHVHTWETYFEDMPHGDLGRIVDFDYIGVNS